MMTMGMFRRQFALFFIFWCLMLAALGAVYAARTGDAPPFGAVIAAFLVALSIPAARLGRIYGREPSSGLYWNLSLQAALVAAVVGAAMALGLAFLLPVDLGTLFATAGLDKLAAEQGFAHVLEAAPGVSAVVGQEVDRLLAAFYALPQSTAAGVAAAAALAVVIIARLLLPIFVRSGIKKLARSY
ncbi:MAG: ABZJ_00895 family protein [Pseudomonadota bacterium]